MRRVGIALAAVGALAVGGAACGDDDDGDAPTPESLEGLLPPAAQVGPLEQERTFTWDNAIDFIFQGVVLPEATAPSSGVEQIEDAGFESGAGEILIPKGRGAPVHVSIAAFDSADGAAEAQAYLHEQALQQPCFAACAVAPEDLPLDEIPGATAVHHVPVKGDLPPELHPFEGYIVVFTLDEKLFYADASGDPGDIPIEDFKRGAIAIYEHAESQSG